MGLFPQNPVGRGQQLSFDVVNSANQRNGFEAPL